MIGNRSCYKMLSVNDAADRLAARVLEDGMLLDVDSVARVLGVSSATVRRLITEGSLPAAQLAGKPHRPYRISASALHQKIAGWTTR